MCSFESLCVCVFVCVSVCLCVCMVNAVTDKTCRANGTGGMSYFWFVPDKVGQVLPSVTNLVQSRRAATDICKKFGGQVPRHIPSFNCKNELLNAGSYYFFNREFGPSRSSSYWDVICQSKW